MLHQGASLTIFMGYDDDSITIKTISWLPRAQTSNQKKNLNGRAYFEVKMVICRPLSYAKLLCPENRISMITSNETSISLSFYIQNRIYFPTVVSRALSRHGAVVMRSGINLMENVYIYLASIINRLLWCEIDGHLHQTHKQLWQMQQSISCIIKLVLR